MTIAWAQDLHGRPASQLPLPFHWNIAICSFLPSHRFDPIICISEIFSNYPRRKPKLSTLNRLYYKSFKPICLCVPTQTICSNQVSMSPVPQMHIVFICTFAQVTFPYQDITSSVCANPTLTHKSMPSPQAFLITQVYWNPSLKMFITGNTDLLFCFILTIPCTFLLPSHPSHKLF